MGEMQLEDVTGTEKPEDGTADKKPEDEAEEKKLEPSAIETNVPMEVTRVVAWVENDSWLCPSWGVSGGPAQRASGSGQVSTSCVSHKKGRLNATLWNPFVSPGLLLRLCIN